MKSTIALLSLLAVAALAACSSGTGSAKNGISSCSASVPASCTTAPSYASEVAPILASYCTSCHSAGGEQSNKPLDSYATASRSASEIENQLATCNMPPSSSSLSTSDANTVLAWIACGAPNN